MRARRLTFNRTLFGLAAACLLALTVGTAEAETWDIAQDFSSQQGYRGWYFGYTQAAEPFQLMTEFGAVPDRWTVDYNQPPPQYWTSIKADWMHPNGVITSGGRTPALQQAVLRWSSGVAGAVRCHGHVRKANIGSGSNGVDWIVRHNGATVFSQYLGGQDGTGFDYDVVIPVAAGDVVDFVLDPHESNDQQDGTYYSATIDDIGPPFEVMYVYPQDQVYQWDGEQVEIISVVRSSWGSGDLQMTAYIKQPLWLNWQEVGSESFSLTSGADHECRLTWMTPDNPHSDDQYHIKVELRDSAGTLLETKRHDYAFTVTRTSDAELERMETDIGSCWLDTGTTCLISMQGVVPVLGDAFQPILFIEDMCAAGRLYRAGRREESAARLQAAFKQYLWIALKIIAPAAGQTVEKVVGWADAATSLMEAADACTRTDLTGDPGGGGGRRQAPATERLLGGASVDSLAAWYRASMDSTELEASDVLFVDGACAPRLEADSSYANVDSTGLIGSSVTVITDSLQVLMTAPDVRRFMSAEGANPNSEALFVLRSQRTQGLNLGLLHRTPADTMAFLRYPELGVNDSTRLVLRVRTDQVEFPIEVDYEADGVVDLLWYPNAQPSGIPNQAGHAPLPAIFYARMVPNPARGSATFIMQAGRPLTGVRVEIFDLAGRKVTAVGVGDLPTGVHSVSWDDRSDAGAPLPSGVYFYRIISDQGLARPERLLVLR